jgi:hypothetical protein
MRAGADDVKDALAKTLDFTGLCVPFSFLPPIKPPNAQTVERGNFAACLDRRGATMDENQKGQVLQYLAAHFPDRQVDQQNDFDRDAESFKVHLDKGTLLLKISGEFLHDVPADVLGQRLDALNTAQELAKLLDSGTGLFVTTKGLQGLTR